MAREDDDISGKAAVKTLSHTGYQAISVEEENLGQPKLAQIDPDQDLKTIVTAIVNPLREAKEKVHQGTDGSQEEMKMFMERLLHIIGDYTYLRGSEDKSGVLPESMGGLGMSDLYPDIDLRRLADQYAEMSMTKQAADNRERRVLTDEQCEVINR